MHYDAEIIDQFQRLFRTNQCNDHQLHCVLRFESDLDLKILRKALFASIVAIPILGTRYIASARPEWALIDSGALKRAFTVVHTEAEFDKFVLTRIDETLGPQVKICLHNVHP